MVDSGPGGKRELGRAGILTTEAGVEGLQEENRELRREIAELQAKVARLERDLLSPADLAEPAADRVKGRPLYVSPAGVETRSPARRLPPGNTDMLNDDQDFPVE